MNEGTQNLIENKDIYQFIWENGVVQFKVLVSHADYLKYKSIDDEDEKNLFWKGVTGGMEWFTDESPLFDSIATGVMNCNGVHKCKTTKL